MQVIYTGLRLLEQQERIKLSYHICKTKPRDLPEHSAAELIVRLNDAHLLLFDMLDFGNLKRERIDRVDFCFKRSFSAALIGPELAYKKVFPLGLVYRVHEKRPSRFALNRLVLEESAGEMAKRAIWTLLGGMALVHPWFYRLHADNCYGRPEPALPDRAIFMTRLWDPSKTVPKYRLQREAINAMRVDCIRKLRLEFGSRFLGGLVHNEYAIRNFADCLAPDARLSIYGNYIRLFPEFPVCIATTGLHNSIGWNFAEYMAFSRAIVSERLHYEAPGLEVGKHYLEFTTGDECVEAASRLMSDRGLRAEMMNRNHEYYKTYLRPDLLVWNALSTALQHSVGTGQVGRVVCQLSTSSPVPRSLASTHTSAKPSM